MLERRLLELIHRWKRLGYGESYHAIRELRAILSGRRVS